MEDKFEIFLEVLEKSIEKHGANKTLTLGHLLNLAKLASTIGDKRQERFEKLMDDIDLNPNL